MLAVHPILLATGVVGLVCFVAVGISSIRLASSGQRPLWNRLLAAFVLCLAIVVLLLMIIAIGL
ncbi:MAG TPA: hypothetical protein PKV27_11540 [Ilumatobacteraceae bacterium]|nr:hypothetical protein [Ilumatobacteraceae bacterium]